MGGGEIKVSTFSIYPVCISFFSAKNCITKKKPEEKSHRIVPPKDETVKTTQNYKNVLI